MKNIIKKMYKGGYRTEYIGQENMSQFSDEFTLDPEFWQALSKSCKWEDTKVILKLPRMEINRVRGKTFLRQKQTATYIKKTPNKWKINALKFHEINLTKGWDKAIAWLEKLIK